MPRGDGPAPLDLGVLELPQPLYGVRGEDGRKGRREQRAEGQRLVHGRDVRLKGGDGRPGHEAPVGVGVAVGKGPRAPQAVAQVHQVAVEPVDVRLAVAPGVDGGGLGARALDAHRVLEGDLERGHDVAEAGDRRRRLAEEEGVEERRRRHLDLAVPLQHRVVEQAQGLVVVVEHGPLRLVGRRGLE